MVILFTIIHVIVCLVLIGVVLLQSGKAADIAGAFGGMGTQTTFGPRGQATVLSRATTICAGLFMVTSLSLAVLSTKNAGAGSGSVIEDVKKPAAATPTKTGGNPAAPAPTPTNTAPNIQVTPVPTNPAAPAPTPDKK
ncbi:MAG: preprotein translocase subunit SecG [Bryobacteraceae bacterium]|nr:preprotein translocase subunit SecG [Bryobacteraceae bacterium]